MMWTSIGEALRFARGKWRFALGVAAAGAAAHTAAFVLLGSTGLWIVALAAVSATVYAALLRAALSDGANAPLQTLGVDALRTFATMAIVTFVTALVGLVLLYIAMSVLIAPYVEEAKTLLEDEAGMRALMERAIKDQPGQVAWLGLIGAGVIFAFTSRFYFAAPGSVGESRVVPLASWARTRGRWLAIMGARFVLLAPALVLAGALQSLVGMALGLGVGDPLALMTRAQTKPLGFVAFFAAAQFLQIAVYTTLEAGLSAALYRASKAPTAG